MDKAKAMFRLDGKIALVTGAGSGLGMAIAEGYTEYGAHVILLDIEEKPIKELAERIADEGGSCFGIKCDVANSKEVKAAVELVLTKFGQIDILVNNAGISDRHPCEETSEQSFDRVIDVNLKGVFLFCREVGREMIKRGKGGRIINMSSHAGIIGLPTGNANYSASKGGVIALSRCLAIEWAKHGILVNSIAPSHLHTPMIDELIATKPEVEDFFKNNISLGRIGNSEEIVGPAIFLASEAASFITGHVLMVDGGSTAK